MVGFDVGGSDGSDSRRRHEQQGQGAGTPPREPMSWADLLIRHKFLTVTLLLWLGVGVGLLGGLWIAAAFFSLVPAYTETRDIFERWRLGGLGLEDLDAITGPEFEQWITAKLEQGGFRCKVVASRPGEGDFGLDLVAVKDGTRIGIQAKRYKKRVGNGAVQQAIAGANHYHCHFPVVVTQSRFTDPARIQARKGKVRVVLVDRWRLRSLGSVLDSAIKAYRNPDPEPENGRDARAREVIALDPGPRQSGYCVGCGGSLPWNPHKPFCKACWKRSDGARQPGRLPKRVCHTCGQEHASTWRKPRCASCWGKGL